jgi:hypothetical protein
MTRFFVLFFLTFSSAAQIRDLWLSNAGSCSFSGYIYSFGLRSNELGCELKVYKLDPSLNVFDSASTQIQHSKPAEFLQLIADTLYDRLNIHIQRKEKKEVRVVRFNRSLKEEENIPSIDITRLNSSQMFGSQALYSRNVVYDIKTENDSSGLQFYLNKYELKNQPGNFEYSFKWQFPFERKDVKFAHVFHAEKKAVWVMAWRENEKGTAQWVLMINASNGFLLKALKVSDKAETGVMHFGQFYSDAVSKNILLTGQVTGNQNKQPGPSAELYLMELDSMCQLNWKQNFRIPIVVSAQGGKKELPIELVRILKIERSLLTIKLHTDLFQPSGACFRYANTQEIFFNREEENYRMQKTVLSADPQLTQIYNPADKLDMSGKTCKSEMAEEIFLTPPANPLKVFMKSCDNSPCWIIRKTDLKKQTVGYSYLRSEKKVYKLEKIETISLQSNPQHFVPGSANFIIGRQMEELRYQLKLYNW